MRVTTDHPSPGVRPAETTSLTHTGAAPTASGHGPSAAHRPAGAPSAIGAAAPTAAAGTLLAPVIAPNPGPTVGHATPSGVAPPTQLPGVASQLLSVITPLRLAASGTQTLTVLLHPEALGDVRATVTTTGTDVIVRLAASTNEGAAALRAAAPDLHSGLSDGGQRASVFVGDPGGQNTAFGGGSPGFNAEQRPSSGSSDARTLDRGPAAVVSSATTHHAVPDSSRLLDLRL